MAPTVGSQNIGASKLGLDTAETNPVLLRKMHRWKQSKHKQRIMEARRGAKPKAGSIKVGVPFARSGFAKDKLPPVNSRAHREMLDESMGDLSATLDNLQAEADSRSTPERAMQDYYEVHAPSADITRQPQRRRQKPSGQARQKRRSEPVSLAARPEFDCTPLETRGDEVSQSGLKIRREHATREPPRKPKQNRALEGIREQQFDRSDVDTAPSPSMDSSSSASDTQPADSEDLTKAQQTIAQLRKLLHAEKEKTTLRVQEAQAEARQKADQLNAALAQTKTQLRMLQKQLHKAREEATAAQQADSSSVATATRDANTAPESSGAKGNTGCGFSRIRLRPRSEQRARDASTPPSRIPEPRLRTPPVRPPAVEHMQVPSVVLHSNNDICLENDEHCSAEVEDHQTVAPSAVEATLELSPPELTEVLSSDDSEHSPTGSTAEPTGESTAGVQEERIEGEGDELVRLERGLSTSTSCSFCVTGSPPMATDKAAQEPPELEANDLSPKALLKDHTDGKGEDDGESDCQQDEGHGAVVELTDRALDGVARALDAIDTTSESIRSEVEAAELGQTAQ
jgi:hypothetical protein